MMMLALALAALCVHAATARAIIVPAVTIDGPSEDIVGFGGVAMAEDGTGGVVYLKSVDGVPHVFVARYVNEHWLAPQRVDTGMPYAASWPRIGAVNGGELVVIWATPFASESGKPVDELVSAMLGPGSSQFGPALIVDRDIRRGTGTSPDLAMSSTGQADLVYRVVQEAQGSTSVPLLRPNDVIEQVRVAHFNGERWTALGPINRDPGLSMRPPSEANAPKIAIGPTGTGIVVWQEPDVEGVARIWARRIFGSNISYVMPATATSFGGAPIGEDADAPAVAFSRLGQAEVAYRQDAGLGSPLPGPRIFLNILPDGESTNGAEFTGAKIADSSVSGGRNALIGPPSIDIDEKRDVRILYDSNGTPRVVEGTDIGLSGSLSLGSPFAGSYLAAANELPSASVMNPSGGGVSAWASADAHGSPGVAVREDFPGGAVQTALVSDSTGGPIGNVAVGRSTLGDGLVAFQQGGLGDAAIVTAQVTSPPADFVISAPKGWIRPSQAQIAWEPAPSAELPVTYIVVLDGHELPTPAGTYELMLDTRRLGDGVHSLQLLATDALGQATLTPPTTLKIDGQPPLVHVNRQRGGNRVLVRVSDAQSGVYAKGVSVSFGDGHRAGGRSSFLHTYTRPGVYTVVVHTRDNLGNTATVRRLVSVP